MQSLVLLSLLSLLPENEKKYKRTGRHQPKNEKTPRPCTCRSCLLNVQAIGSTSLVKRCPDSCSTEPCGKKCKKKVS